MITGLLLAGLISATPVSLGDQPAKESGIECADRHEKAKTKFSSLMPALPVKLAGADSEPIISKAYVLRDDFDSSEGVYVIDAYESSENSEGLSVNVISRWSVSAVRFIHFLTRDGNSGSNSIIESVFLNHKGDLYELRKAGKGYFYIPANFIINLKAGDSVKARVQLLNGSTTTYEVNPDTIKEIAFVYNAICLTPNSPPAK